MAEPHDAKHCYDNAKDKHERYKGAGERDQGAAGCSQHHEAQYPKQYELGQLVHR